MNFRRGNVDPPPAPCSTEAATPKINRLRRSYRRTQTVETEPPSSEQLEFKTPTRVPTSRAGGGVSEESPQNDSDFQQDIIWDATSPSPHRLSKGKRGRKPTGTVNISEIVSRIAPKHGRPKVAEPTLQQWIGDTIPCTPDVQAPKPKKKSPRLNGVDDLLKLAQRFDFNMFHRDEDEEEEDPHQQSLELLSDDILDVQPGDQNHLSPPLPGNHQPAAGATGETVRRVELELQMDDDLDFLFDGPTQHVSRNFSQVTQVKLPLSAPVSASLHTVGVSTTNARAAPVNDDFEDDWENDDLLNDSLVLEMTQNPVFAAPQHRSTQNLPVNGPTCSGSAAVGQEPVRQRSTFRLESNPRFSAQRSQTPTWTKPQVDSGSKGPGLDSQQSRFGASGGAGSQFSWKNSNPVKPEPQGPQFNPKTPVRTVPETAQSVTQRPAAASDPLDEDLNLFFSSDPDWDDDDDDLLREMCEDVENQIHNGPNKQVLPGSTQRAALQPTTRTWVNQIQQLANQKPSHQTPPSAAGGSYSGGSVPHREQRKPDPFRFTQTKNTSGSRISSECEPGSSRVQTAPPQNVHKGQFTFKRPSNPVSTGTSKAVGKCSAAEIELKKQAALERRRQKLQATQNLRAPT